MKVRGILTLMVALLLPLCAFAAQGTAQTPVLTSVSFNNARINEAFSPEVNEYTLTLDDPSNPPTLKDYTVDGTAKLFVNYLTDDAKHQTGVEVTVEYESGTAVYRFMYANAQTFPPSDDNYLQSLSGELTEVYPQLNKTQTHYRLYIPKDMTALRLTAVTHDIGAYCDIPAEITVNTEQEPNLKVTVTASDGTARVYTFHIKRSEFTSAEVTALQQKGGFTYADELLFYRKPAFRAAAVSAVLGLAAAAALLHFLRRAALKVQDSDETEFFETI